MRRAVLFAIVGILFGFFSGLVTSAQASRYAFGEREIFLASCRAINTLLQGTGISVAETATDEGVILDLFIDPETLPEYASARLNLVSVPESGLTLTGIEGETYTLEIQYDWNEDRDAVDYGGVLLLSGLR